MEIPYLFLLFLAMFTFLGTLRGWAKDILIIFSVILALTTNFMMRRYIPIVTSLVESDPTLFWVRILILLTMIYFGYMTVVSIPALLMRAEMREARFRIFDPILGLITGYLLAGSLLFYVYIADYPFAEIILRPTNPGMIQFIDKMMLYMPQRLLGEPGIYFALIASLIFMIVTYVGIPSRVFEGTKENSVTTSK